MRERRRPVSGRGLLLAGPLLAAALGVCCAGSARPAVDPAALPGVGGAAPSGEAGRAAPPEPSLAQTGLYRDFASRSLAPDVLAYSPQYPLWSDGAAKRRFLRLPPGTTIDAADPDHWVFPVGTRVFKEFSFHGRPVETRLLVATAPGVWRFATYVWSPDGRDARLAPDTGLRDVVPVTAGVAHDIPGLADCRDCHDNPRTEVLGFSALQLADERDPLAPDAEPLPPGAVGLRALLARQLLRNAPTAWREHPPRIDARSPRERAALGYLHANCGNCHHSSSAVPGTELALRHLERTAGAGEPALRSAVGRRGRAGIPGLAAGVARLIAPGQPAHSTVWNRMTTRAPLRQMPPLGTELVDEQAATLVADWIRDDLPRWASPSTATEPGR